MSRGDFARRLRELRRRHDLSQKELARRADLSADSIRKLERGQVSPRLDTLEKLSAGLDVPTAALILDKYDEADDLAHLIRELPEMQRQVAYAILGSLCVHAAVQG